MAGLPPVFIEFLGKSTGVKTALADIKAETAAAAAEGEGAFGQFGRYAKAAVLGIGIAAAAVAIATVHMAADFQTQMTRVQTGAGEAASNIKMVGDGVLAMAGQVGESTTDLTSGLYTVESAGYHGADALNVLKNAAEGAKVGAADLATVTDAVTTGLNAYHMGASQAATVTNELIATEAEGKTNMEALAGSMASILPTASAAHVGLQEVLGAMATMTSQGTPAAVAATYLRQTIGMLSNPSAKAAGEMKDLGLSSVQVAQNLGKNGLASTLTELTDAIQNHMGPAGTVLIKHLQDAAANTTAYQKVLADLPPAQQTYIGALATMVGGTKSMQAALELTGPHMATFQADTKGIATHVKDAGNGIEGWAAVQATFNQRMAEAKAGVQAMGIQIGNMLLPAVTSMAGVLATAVTWLTRHRDVAKAAAIVIGGALVFALAAVTAQLVMMAAAAAVNPITWIIVGVVAVIAALVLLAMHWRQVWGVIKEVGEAVGRGVAAAWDWVVRSTEDAWRHVTSAVSTGWHAVGSFLSGAWHDVADPVAHAWDTVTSAVTTAWDDTVSFLVGAWHSVVDPLVQAWDAVQDVTVTAWNAVAGFFKKWWPLLLVIFALPLALLLAAWNHWHQAVFNAARSAWGTISGWLSAAWHTIQAGAGLVWRGIQTAIINPIVATWHRIVQVWDIIAGYLAKAWAGTKQAAGVAWAAVQAAVVAPVVAAWHRVVQVWDIVTAYLAKAWSGTKAAAGAAWSAIEAAIINPVISAWHSVTSYIGRVASTVSTGMNNAYNAVKGIGAKFAQIGMDIINGIINGAENRGSALFGSIKNIANGALKAAKNFLGIKSPSKVFADEVGQWIPHGIAQGVAAHASVAHAAVASLAGSLSLGPGIGLGTTGIGAGTLAGAGSASAQQMAQVTTIVQLDGQTIFQAVQPHALVNDRRNSRPGLVLTRA